MHLLRLAALFTTLVGVGLAGCGQPAPKTAHLSGKVTFKGKPVPMGFVIFQGDTGPVKSVKIVDGAYDTASAGDAGVIPGPTKITITGFDGKPVPYFHQGKQIFNAHEIREVVPEGTSTKDFDVPASAANNLRIVPTADIP